MKKPFIVLPFISLLVFTLVSFGFSDHKTKNMNAGIARNGFAVVELFTSEGCSSCPPADEAVAALVKDYPSNVYVLGFHVDYWNNLGWKDAFSDAVYSNRQQAYASVLALNSVYTPQVIINGKTEFTGSDKRRLYTTVEQELNGAGAPAIELHARSKDSKDIVVDFRTDAGKGMLHVALVQLNAVSAVKRGENRGKQLHHVDVVRNFKTVTENGGSVTMTLPEGLSAKDCKIIAFAQNKTDLRITGAAACMIQ